MSKSKPHPKAPRQFVIELKAAYKVVSDVYWDTLNDGSNKKTLDYQLEYLAAFRDPEAMRKCLKEGAAAIFFADIMGDIENLQYPDRTSEKSGECTNAPFIVTVMHEGKLWGVFADNDLDW